jgi:hypothetical protein
MCVRQKTNGRTGRNNFPALTSRWESASLNQTSWSMLVLNWPTKYMNMRQYNHKNMRQYNYVSMRHYNHMNMRRYNLMNMRQYNHMNMRQYNYISMRQYSHMNMWQYNYISMRRYNSMNMRQYQRGLTEEMPENAQFCIQKAATYSHFIRSTPF